MTAMAIDIGHAKKWQEYHERRNKWVAYNFPTTDGSDPEVPCLETTEGIIEEAGELAHAHLKKKQAIRGTPEQHDKDMKDAIGDMTVYLWGITGKQEPHFVDENFWAKARNQASHPSRFTRHRILSIASNVGKVAEFVALGFTSSPVFKSEVARLVGDLWGFCEEQGWLYHTIVDETWTAVEKRDWQQFPHDGLTK